MADAPRMREIPVYSPDMANPYMPYIATLKEVVRETHNIMTFRVVLDDEEAMKNFRHEPGQVGQLSLFGVVTK